MADDIEVKKFVQRINRRAEDIKSGVDKLRKAAAEEILAAVVFATPADTGRARSNWKIGVGAPPRGYRRPYAPGRRLGLGETSNANAAISVAQQKLAAVRLEDDLYVGNNAPYIMKLNDGWSAQAPANFIERAIQRGSAVARRAKLLR